MPSPLTFPRRSPRPMRQKRLVHVDHLMLYRPLFSAGATVTLRTDSKPLRDYASERLPRPATARFRVSNDVRRDHPEHPETEYECRTREMGAAVYGICATPGAQPSDEQLAAGRAQEQSLACYLPENLDALTYVPLGWKRPSRTLETAPAKARSACRQESHRGF